MDTEELVEFIIQVIGTIGYSSTGAMLAIRKRLNVFGVIIMAMLSAAGGGVIRDMILGVHPAKSFNRPIFLLYSMITALILFFAFYFRNHRKIIAHPRMGQLPYTKMLERYERFMNVTDAVGLAVFTMVGVKTAWELGYESKFFLLMTMGMISSMGGGITRDTLLMEKSLAFTDHMYALASAIGAMVCVFIMPYNKIVAMLAGLITIMVLRLVGKKNRWNWPTIPDRY